MRLTPSKHPTEDDFEEYAFGRVAEDAASDFEEHLLICEQCQHALTRTTEYIHVMKAASAAYVADHPTISPRKQFRSESLRRNAAAAAVLLLMCLTGLLSWRNPPSDPTTIALEAYRAGGPSALAQAPAGRPLDLQIDLKDLPPASRYRVEVVDTNGRRVWFGGTPARLTKGLPAGTYWIRLFAESGELLREFGLQAG